MQLILPLRKYFSLNGCVVLRPVILFAVLIGCLVSVWRDPLLGSVTEQTIIYFCLLVLLFVSGKLEIDLTYVTSLYSEHICTRCYYLYSLTPLTLLGLVGIY